MIVKGYFGEEEDPMRPDTEEMVRDEKDRLRELAVSLFNMPSESSDHEIADRYEQEQMPACASVMRK